MFNPARIDWSTDEIKVSGVGYAICGVVGAASILIFDLIGPIVVGTPWFIVSNPFIWIFFATSLIVQVLIEQHHRRRWPFKRSSASN
jgi:predicted permease